MSADNSLLLVLVHGIAGKENVVYMIHLSSKAIVQTIGIDIRGGVRGCGFLFQNLGIIGGFAVFIDSEVTEMMSQTTHKPAAKLRKYSQEERRQIMLMYTSTVSVDVSSQSLKFSLAGSQTAVNALEYLPAHACSNQRIHHAFIAVCPGGSLLAATVLSPSAFAGSMYPPGFTILQQAVDHKETETELDLEEDAVGEEDSGDIATSAGYKCIAGEVGSSAPPVRLTMAVVPGQHQQVRSQPVPQSKTLSSDANHALFSPLQFLNLKKPTNEVLQR
jgi:hypothetical protein